jgi:uncharacterized protein (TIGR00730 family)
MDNSTFPQGRICVFCGSHCGAEPAYRTAAEKFGRLLAAKGLALVYGGGNVGLMGTIAEAAMAGEGEVIGVIPRSLVDREVAHHGLSELVVVDSMHERKHKLYEISDAVVALPGGMGTLDELFEALTWNQLEIHFKPAGLLNVAGYWDPLVTMLDRMVEQGFVRAGHRALLQVESTGEELLAALGAARGAERPAWVKPQTVG